MQNGMELQKSIQRHEQYALSDPTNVSLQATLGDLYHAAGRFDDALTCFDRCLLLQPTDVRARSRSASVLISQHRFSDAELRFRNLIESGEADPVLLHNLGLSQFYQERWEDAVENFILATERGLVHASNFKYLARALHHLERTREAAEAAKRCADISGLAEDKGYVALLEMEDGNMSLGFTLAKEVLAQDPEEVFANVVAGTEAVEKQESQQAQRHFAAALARDKDNGRAWLGLGLVHLYEQENALAIDALQNAMRVFPQNSGIIVTLGWAHIVDQNPRAAQKIFEHALSVDRNFSESHAGLAAALAIQGQFDRAKEEINTANRLDPRGFGATVASTFLLAGQGQQAAAAKVFGKLLGQSPREGVAPLIEQLRLYLTNHKIRKDATSGN